MFVPYISNAGWRPREPSISTVLVAALLLSGLRCASAADVVPRMLLLDGAVAGSDVIAVGERGTILRTADNAQSWRMVPSPTRATLTAIAIAPLPGEPRGWAVGHDATILATADGGRTWQKQFQGENLEASFLDVIALNARHAIAVGAYGLCYETHDSGGTWEKRTLLAADSHLNRITRGAAGTLFVAGENGTILRSDDEGRTWKQVTLSYKGSFYGVLPFASGALLAHGLSGHVYRSTDDGSSWSPVAIPTTALIATAVQMKNGAIAFAGYAGTLLASRDDGATFGPLASPPPKAVARLLELPDGNLLALGEAGATVIAMPR
jgi:photosystem II stability/assembly factor-like uncharacterized protein